MRGSHVEDDRCSHYISYELTLGPSKIISQKSWLGILSTLKACQLPRRLLYYHHRQGIMNQHIWPEQPERLPSIYLDSFEDLPMNFNHVHDHLGPAAPSSTYTQSCILGFTPSQTCRSAQAFTHCDAPTGYSSTPNVSSLHQNKSHLLYRHIPASQPIISHFSCCHRAVVSTVEHDQPEMAVTSSGRDLLPISHSHSGQATNFVSLSRKSSSKRSSFLFWKQTSNSSSIIGAFVIDPLLRLPTGLLKVIDSPLHTPHQNRKNLLLEVENGGINVDIYLVPSKIQSRSRREAAAVTVDPELEQKRSIDVRYLHPDSARTHVDEPRTMQRSCSRLLQDNDSQAPTRIDLRLKAGRPNSGRKYELIARIVSFFPLFPPYIRTFCSLLGCTEPPTTVPRLGIDN